MGGGKSRRYWLLKTEPREWSWSDQKSSPNGAAPWDGVKNRQAQNNMKSMRKGDLCLFYHSGARERRVVGVVEVVRPWYGDNDREGAVDVRSLGELRRAVDLGEIKKEEGMKGFGLVRQPRLSVVPVEERVWERILEMGGGIEEEVEGSEGG